MKNYSGHKGTVAVLLAAGSGKRMGGQFKPFLKLNGAYAIFYSLTEFLRAPFVDEIVIAVPADKKKYVQRLISSNVFSKKPVSIIGGGRTRQASVYMSLKYINEMMPEPYYVIFHDAARPLVSQKTISLIYNSALKYGASVAATKITDLATETKNGFVYRPYHKDTIYGAATPQCFKFIDIFSAHRKYGNSKNLKSGDNLELLLLKNKSQKIKVVGAFYPNFKLTYRADTAIIENLLTNDRRK